MMSLHFFPSEFSYQCVFFSFVVFVSLCSVILPWDIFTHIPNSVERNVLIHLSFCASLWAVSSPLWTFIKHLLSWIWSCLFILYVLNIFCKVPHYKFNSKLLKVPWKWLLRLVFQMKIWDIEDEMNSREWDNRASTTVPTCLVNHVSHVTESYCLEI